MAAMPTGLNLGEALNSLPPECDRDASRRLLIAAEPHFLIAMNKKAKNNDD